MHPCFNRQGLIPVNIEKTLKYLPQNIPDPHTWLLLHCFSTDQSVMCVEGPRPGILF